MGELIGGSELENWLFGIGKLVGRNWEHFLVGIGKLAGEIGKLGE